MVVICNNCGAEHHQPGIDFTTSVPSKILKERGEQNVNSCRECRSTDLREEKSIMIEDRKL